MFNIEELSQKIESKCLSLPIYDSEYAIYEPIKYIMMDGGKRMRPMLTLLAANIFSDDIDQAISSAIALEVYHNFTLLHDDIMDKAPMRRGRQTVHVKWDENTAILSGDAMLILSYQILCSGTPSDKLPMLLSEFNKMAMEVCHGQQFDMEFENLSCVTIEQYIEMIRLKTAVFMASALKMGAISQSATEDRLQSIYDFGINLGLAFQIQDDLLDTYGDSETFGKNIGGDIAVGKQTFLRISALKTANIRQRMTLENSREYEEIRAVYDDLKVRQTAQLAIEDYFQRAIICLKNCSNDSSRLEPMQQYALSLLKRKK